MIRAHAVFVTGLTGLLLVAGTAVEDPAAPEGLDPVETLVNPTRYSFKEMEESGYEVEKEYELAEEDGEFTDTEYKKEQSSLISMHLKHLESVKNRRVEEDVKNALDTMRLLVAHSWLYSFNPEKDLLQGTVPIPIDESASLSKIKSDIAKELKERNSRTPVSDDILLYSEGLFQPIKEDLKSNVDAYSKMILDGKLLSKITDATLKEKCSENNKHYRLLMEKNTFLLKIHPIAFKMAIQTYVRLFMEDREEGQEKIRLQSGNGEQNKELSMPPLDADKFEQLVFESEMEEDADRVPVDDQEVTELSRKQQNDVVHLYLKTVEAMAMTTFSKFHDAGALQIVKLLFLQSWIHMLSPDLNLIAEVYPVETSSTLDTVHENIALEVKKTLTHAEVVDSIIRFANLLHSQIRVQFLVQAHDLFPMIDEKINTITTLENGPERDRELILLKDNVKKLENFNLMSQLHEISTKMCLQSYVLDFLTEPYTNPVTLTSTTGEQLTMDIPPLGKDSYEELAIILPDEPEDHVDEEAATDS